MGSIPITRSNNTPHAVVAQLVERHLAKVEVASPSLVYRSIFCGCNSMVEFQPSKLATWVRFPSPALDSREDSRAAPSGANAPVRDGQEFFLSRTEKEPVPNFGTGSRMTVSYQTVISDLPSAKGPGRALAPRCFPA